MKRNTRTVFPLHLHFCLYFLGNLQPVLKVVLYIYTHPNLDLCNIRYPSYVCKNRPVPSSTPINLCFLIQIDCQILYIKGCSSECEATKNIFFSKSLFVKTLKSFGKNLGVCSGLPVSMVSGMWWFITKSGHYHWAHLSQSIVLSCTKLCRPNLTTSK